MILGYGIKDESSNISVKLPGIEIESAINEINNSASGQVVKVEMNDAKVASKNILKAAQGKDVDVVFDMGDYTWTVNGKSIVANNDINLFVTFDTNAIPENVVNNLAQGLPVNQLSLAHNGEFGFTGALRFNMETCITIMIKVNWSS